MKYRPLGKLAIQVSALGFGAMRLPTLPDGAVNEPLAIEMLRYAIDHGVNYIDTAYPYHNQTSEVIVGKALRNGYREKVYLATKLNARWVETAADLDRLLDEQRAKLQVDALDFYLLHGMRRSRWDQLRALNVLDWAEKRMAEGAFKHLGFSFHDNLDLFHEIIDSYDNWALAQVQYNYMDVENQAGTAGVQYAASKGLGVVVMEPLLGGKLVSAPPQVQALWDSAPVRRSPVEWAFQWLWDQPEVSLTLSGMSTMEQVVENVAYAERAGDGHLTEAERGLVARAREVYNQLCPIPCTACEYCMPCPNGVNIPGNFRWYNSGAMYNQWAQARGRYARMAEGERASECVQCRLCEELCPQSIEISQWMPEVDEVLGQGKEYVCRTR